MYVSYTDEQNIIRSMVRDFANNELEPTAAQRDEEERFDRDLFDKMGKLGLTGSRGQKHTVGLGPIF